MTSISAILDRVNSILLRTSVLQSTCVEPLISVNVFVVFV